MAWFLGTVILLDKHECCGAKLYSLSNIEPIVISTGSGLKKSSKYLPTNEKFWSDRYIYAKKLDGML
jgi:hypothetical protein